MTLSFSAPGLPPAAAKTDQDWLENPSLSAHLSKFGQLFIYSDNSGQGGIIDTHSDQILEVDSSCSQQIVSSGQAEEYFYNDRADLFTQGPYKTIYSISDQPDTYEQIFCTGGCCRSEAEIKVKKDGLRAICEVSIRSQSLGC